MELSTFHESARSPTPFVGAFYIAITAILTLARVFGFLGSLDLALSGFLTRLISIFLLGLFLARFGLLFHALLAELLFADGAGDLLRRLLGLALTFQLLFQLVKIAIGTAFAQCVDAIAHFIEALVQRIGPCGHHLFVGHVGFLGL